jgi:NDP-sugar pyrophosphorylase family protein
MARKVRQAVVLVGGKGTRLGGLTAHTPKPLLPVAGVPFLDWVMGLLDAEGITDVVLAGGFQGGVLRDWLGQRKAQATVRTFIEDEPLGTGGALPKVADWLDDVFFVLNGDTLLDVPLQALGARLIESGAVGAVALRHIEDVARYGSVELDGDRVVSFGEKSTDGPGWINGGVYALRRGAIDRLGSPSSLERDLFPVLAESGDLVGLRCDGFFIDIGLPETYAAAQRSVPEWWWHRNGELPPQSR